MHSESWMDVLIGMVIMLGLCGEIVIAMAFLSLWVK